MISMKKIPETDNVLVLRTDFSNDEEWNSVRDKITTPNEKLGVVAHVEFLSDKNFEGYSPENILKSIPDNYEHSIIFIIDKETILGSDSPILCLDLYDEPGRSFRVIPSAMW